MLISDLIPRSLKCAWEEKPNALDLVLSQSVHDECDIPQCAVCDQRQDFVCTDKSDRHYEWTGPQASDPVQLASAMAFHLF